MRPLSIPLLFLPLLPQTLAWGTLGHQTIAYLASNFVSPSTETFFQTLLNNKTDAYLAGVATWADSYRYTEEGKYSAVLHFIDAEDDVPRWERKKGEGFGKSGISVEQENEVRLLLILILACGVKYARDCGEKGCVVAAIQNFVSSEFKHIWDESPPSGLGIFNQLLSPDTTEYDRYIAAKPTILSKDQLTHHPSSSSTPQFVGDIHQPLHDENISQGGNGIRVNFTGTSTNLHHVWDTSIPEKLIGGYSMADAHAWANALTIAIKSGVYASQAESWLQGMDIRDPITTSLAWANEANAFICTTVMPEGAEGVLGKELSGEYYENGVPVVQLQVAKAGYRLAAWLDMIAGDEKEEL
ncbi:nuclease s1 protein [Rutstroemia sp. NJR-2017a WRK4]|nr:nuclease s1 protein [Rutstroemia sp. NJR-2017a WRK4]